jgi:hypothetical protein
MSDERHKRLIHGICGGIFLIGLAILFYLDIFWPWILALVGIIIIIETIAKH